MFLCLEAAKAVEGNAYAQWRKSQWATVKNSLLTREILCAAESSETSQQWKKCDLKVNSHRNLKIRLKPGFYTVWYSHNNKI